MKQTNYNLFAILKALKGNLALMNSFIEKDYNMAKLYFQGYIENDPDFENYKLFKIATINKDLEIQPCKVFITGGLEICSYKQQDKIKQIKLDLENQFEAEKEQDTIKQIEILFGGRTIE